MGGFYASEITHHLGRQKVISNMKHSHLEKCRIMTFPQKFALRTHATENVTLKRVGASVVNVHFEFFSLLVLELNWSKF